MLSAQSSDLLACWTALGAFLGAVRRPTLRFGRAQPLLPRIRHHLSQKSIFFIFFCSGSGLAFGLVRLAFLCTH